MNPFFPPPSGISVREIAALTGATPRDDAALDRIVSGIAALDRARAADIVYVDSAKHVAALAATGAGVCLTSDKFEARAPTTLIVLRSKQPFRDFVTVARKLYPDALHPTSLFDGDGGGPGANVHPTAEIEDGVTIDPGAVIGPRAAIGGGTMIGANAVIGPDVQIGRDGSVGPGASIVHALIGDNVIIHAGCRIGQDGFRYHGTMDGHIKVPQLAASSSRIMSRSAPAPRSTAAASATPSSARAPRSTTSCRSATTAGSAGIASSSRNAGCPAASRSATM